MTPTVLSEVPSSVGHSTGFPTRRDVGLAVLLVGATLLVYGQVAGFEFVDFDDPIYVISNLQVMRGLTGDGVRWAFAEFHDGNWIPLTWLSLMLDSSLFHGSPGGYHVTNLLLHTVNVLLVFALFRKATANSLRSAFVAALFAVHPLHVESVAWIAERKDVLSMLFGLASLYCYVAYVPLRRTGWFVASLGLFLCSLMSKQTLVTLPFVFLLLDYWPLARFAGKEPFLQRARRLFVEKLPFLAASAAFCVIAIFAQSSAGAVRDLTWVPIGSRCLNAVLVYGLYLQDALFPAGLAPYYPHPADRLNLTDVALAFGFLSAVSVGAIAFARRWPFLPVGWFWYLGSLVPVIGLVQIGGQQMADRYCYFPLLGIYVVVAWLVPSLLPDSLARGRVLPAIATIIVVAYGSAAFLQAGYWRDGVTLFRHTLDVTPDNAFARKGLASALFRSGKLPEALNQLQGAVKLEPGDARGHYSLGRVLQAMERREEAVREFESAISIDPVYADAHVGLGAALTSLQRYEEAKRQFERALEIDPNAVDADVNLGFLYGQIGDYPKCIEYSERALALNPTLVECHLNIAVSLSRQGQLDAAIDRLRHLLTIAPDHRAAQSELKRVMALKTGG